MDLLPPDQRGPASTAVSQPTTYAEKLKVNGLPAEVSARSAKKAFIKGVDSKVIGTSAMFNGRQTIFVSKEEDDFMAAPFQYSLVGKFSHGYPTMSRLRAKFAALGLNKGFKIGVLDHKHVWIRLFDPNDYARVWMKQTWYFDGFPMRVLKWTSNFDPKEESPIMPVWVKVFGLRPHWFHRQFLYHVASLIGKPLKLDEATTEIENPMFARMCVEINVLDRLLPDVPIQIDGKTQYFKVTYEGIPDYCKIYRHRGHSMTACYERKDHVEDEGGYSNNLAKEPQQTKEIDLRKILERKREKEPLTTLENGQKVVMKESNIHGDVGCSKMLDANPNEFHSTHTEPKDNEKQAAMNNQEVEKIYQDPSENPQEISGSAEKNAIHQENENFQMESSTNDQELTRMGKKC
ncbi:hypothetical protein BUALT_Bualt12G0032800 [Buddleja alternifolia]|uniref:DUF4283 domain-containing protein n=1 Tax=Buddleja alternifolia TaxID=168488 RepID=A0AAV6WPW3_9LAMI|nr:hypothetical protein BUALT_Bualt12G0032800 [Buddleja alternifolia]